MSAFHGASRAVRQAFAELVTPNVTTGNVFYVDSGSSSAGDTDSHGKRPSHPFNTLDYAVGKCTASNGDRIYVMPGHAETVSAAAGLDLDVVGITIEFLGDGNARGSITFDTVVGADMDVDAADITLIKPRFIAGIDALTGPIDVNAARFKMVDATWQDGTGFNTTDCLVADANADDMTIDGFEFIDGDAAGTQKQSFIQIAGATRPTLKRIKCTGDFATGIIENGTAWVDALLEDAVLDNANTSPTVCILLQGTSTGTIRNADLRVASGSTPITATNDMQIFRSEWVSTDSRSGGKIGTVEGVTTYPAAAAPANGVSVEAVARDIWDALRNGTGGAEPATNRALADYLGVSPAFFVPGLGFGVTKTCDLGGANDDLFTVTGKVLITHLSGEVTTVLSGAESFNLRVKTDNVALCAATTIDSDADGTHYLVSGDFGDALNGASTPGLRAADTNGKGGRAFVVGDAGGTATIESNTTGNGGAILFTLYYLPLEANASVAASA